MNAIINYIEDDSIPCWEGYVFATCLFMSFFLKTFFNQYSYFYIFKISIYVINIVNLGMM
jgi:hypothetical protein